MKKVFQKNEITGLSKNFVLCYKTAPFSAYYEKKVLLNILDFGYIKDSPLFPVPESAVRHCRI